MADRARLILTYPLGFMAFLATGCTSGFEAKSWLQSSASSLGTNAHVSISTVTTAQPTTGDVTISKMVLGSPLTIRSSGHMAGAIDSLVWGGMEFINADDHGRELQSASSFDSFGECFNPTEAGAGYDAYDSSSVLLARNASGDELQTSTDMAFWLRPGSTYFQNCGATTLRTAQNAGVRGGHVLSKDVRIGFAEFENVIGYSVNFHVPENHANATFEALTGYMPTSFSTFQMYDPASDSLQPVDGGAGEQTNPLIFSTPDGSHAMGIFSPDLPQAEFPNAGYGHFSAAVLGNADTVKWNCVFRKNNVPAGDYGFQCLVVVGNRDQVAQTIGTLYKRYKHPVMGHIDAVQMTAQGNAITGWACASGLPDSLTVHLYRNGTAGVGQFVTATTANLASEPAVAQSCGSSGTNYRFSFVIPQSQANQFAGQSIFIHAISPNGQANLAIANSGTFTFQGSAPAATGVPLETVYRLYNGSDHLFSLSLSEGTADGYHLEGPAFMLASAQVTNTVALYRCYQPSLDDHFLSTRSDCEGQTVEMVLGYISSDSSHRPLYRFVHPTSHMHFESLSSQEGTDAGFTLEGIIGFTW